VRKGIVVSGWFGEEEAGMLNRTMANGNINSRRVNKGKSM